MKAAVFVGLFIFRQNVKKPITINKQANEMNRRPSEIYAKHIRRHNLNITIKSCSINGTADLSMAANVNNKHSKRHERQN